MYSDTLQWLIEIALMHAIGVMFLTLAVVLIFLIRHKRCPTALKVLLVAVAFASALAPALWQCQMPTEPHRTALLKPLTTSCDLTPYVRDIGAAVVGTCVGLLIGAAIGRYMRTRWS